MPRVTKDPQIRMAEIIDAAEELFNVHGYQETQISDIVKAIGVAQGTFYYYFKSKEDVLEAVVRRKIDLILTEVERIAAKKLAASRKMSLVVRTILNRIRTPHEALFEFLHCDQYLHILDRLGRQAIELFAPTLIRVVDEGVEEGCFEVAYPEETVDFIIGIIRVMVDSLYKKDGAEKLAPRMEITQQLIETALGAAPGSLSLEE